MTACSSWSGGAVVVVARRLVVPWRAWARPPARNKIFPFFVRDSFQRIYRATCVPLANAYPAKPPPGDNNDAFQRLASFCIDHLPVNFLCKIDRRIAEYPERE